ncbi:MAG: hypothetical protein U1G07_08465 [Verrucomicrobiota bacterium]
MKTRTTYSLALTSTLIGLATYAGNSHPTHLPTVGPGTISSADVNQPGFLQVHSARISKSRDLPAEMFFWNNDFGRNDFARGAGYSRYVIYDAAGKVVRQVPEAARPVAVQLEPGVYRIEAMAQDSATVSVPVVLSVQIDQGSTTVVHLDGDWIPPVRERAKLVRMSNGHFVGWPATSAK